jgi:hypothetical protein
MWQSATQSIAFCKTYPEKVINETALAGGKNIEQETVREREKLSGQLYNIYLTSKA